MSLARLLALSAVVAFFPTAAASQTQVLTLTVPVTDAANHPVVGARVNVYRFENAPRQLLESLSAQGELSGSPDAAGRTRGNGLADVQVTVEPGLSTTLILEVSSDGLSTTRRRIDLGVAPKTSLRVDPMTLAGKSSQPGTPGAGDQLPLQIMIEVRDDLERLVPNANVDIRTSSGRLLTPQPLLAPDGRAVFTSASVPDVPLAELRRGLVVEIYNLTDYEWRPSDIAPSLLEPGAQPRLFQIHIKPTFQRLREKVEGIEGLTANLMRAVHVPVNAYSPAVESARQDAQARADRILAAAAKAKAVDSTSDGCLKSQTAASNIHEFDVRATALAADLDAVFDTALRAAKSCSSPSDGALIRSQYQKAIGFVYRLGEFNKEAQSNYQKITDFSTASSTFAASFLATVQGELNGIETDAAAAASARDKAEDAYNTNLQDAGDRFSDSLRVEALSTRSAYLEQVTAYGASAPPRLTELGPRLDRVLARINDYKAPVKPHFEDIESIRNAEVATGQIAARMRELIKTLDQSACVVDNVDASLAHIQALFDSAAFNLGLGSTLMSEADRCDPGGAAKADPPDKSLDDIDKLLDDNQDSPPATSSTGDPVPPSRQDAPKPRGPSKLDRAKDFLNRAKQAIDQYNATHPPQKRGNGNDNEPPRGSGSQQPPAPASNGSAFGDLSGKWVLTMHSYMGSPCTATVEISLRPSQPNTWIGEDFWKIALNGQPCGDDMGKTGNLNQWQLVATAPGTAQATINGATQFPATFTATTLQFPTNGFLSGTFFRQ